MISIMKKLVISLAVSALTISAAHADWWQDGNLVVLRVGDGVGGLVNTGNPIFLDQFTSGGSLFATLTIPSSGASAMLESGSASSEGFLTRYNKTVLFMGYNTSGGVGSLPNASGGTAPRTIGQVDINGTYSLPYSSTTAFSGTSGTGGNPRAAVTDGAGNYWGVGSGSSTANRGVYYFGSGTPAFIHNGSGSVSPRDAEIVGGNLLFSAAPSSGTRGIFGYTGTPTTSQGATLPPVVINTGATSSPYDFVINTTLGIAYVSDDTAGTGGGVQRYNWNGSAWTLAYTLSTGASSGARGMAVDFSGSTPLVYVTTSETSTTANNRLGYFNDSGNSSLFNLLVTAPANEQFRGIEFTPAAIPEPGTAALLGMGILAFWSRSRSLRRD
jgi:hypothetical protein